jgi:hypothetical protein
MTERDAPVPRSLGMARTMQQERFADVFLLAVAAVAGCTVARPEVDDDSIDWTLSCRLTPRRPKLDVQMKSTIHAEGDETRIRYALNRKNYDDLILQEVAVPRILILVIVPANVAEWMYLSTEQLVLLRGAYWISLVGKPESNNDISVTVSVPRANLFTVEGLRGIMMRINEGGAP